MQVSLRIGRAHQRECSEENIPHYWRLEGRSCISPPLGVLNGLFLFGNSIIKVDKGKRDENFLSGVFICISNDNSKKVVCICNQHDKSPVGKTKLNFPSKRDKKIVGYL